MCINSHSCVHFQVEILTPVVQFSGDIYDPDSISIQMDNITICEGIEGLVAGITVLLAVYYTYGVQYPSAADNTLSFIQKFLLKLDTESRKPSNTILRLAGAIL